VSQTARFGPGRLALTLVASAAAWALVAALCLCIGSTGAIGWPSSTGIFALRREMVLLASLVGAALGAAGVAYQAILRNPLADPYLLGVSSGATLAAYLWTLPAGAALGAWLPATQPLAAFVGALAAVAIVLTVASARRRLEPLTLLLVGVILNSINGAAFILVDALHKNLPATGGPMSFLVGGLQSNLSSEQEWSAAVVIFAGLVVLLYAAASLNVATLSDAEARSLGVRIVHLRWVVLIAASLITAAAVAVSGPIGFVGLICPHAMRLIVGRDHRLLLPASAAAGAALLAVADAASRALAGAAGVGTLLPVGVLTALLGGPFFLWLLFRSRQRGQI
jgi:iron complex transport system permease protein